MKILHFALVAAAAMTLNGCTWVDMSAEGEKVRVLTAKEVTGCRHVGKTTVSTTGKIAVVERNPEKVQEELDTLARNSAPELNGDTVVRVGEPVNGKQVYEIYHCMPSGKK